MSADDLFADGKKLGGEGKYEEAIASYDKAIEIDPKYTKAWINKGNALRKLGRHEDAIVCYDRAIELDPKNTLAEVMKAGVESKQNKGW